MVSRFAFAGVNDKGAEGIDVGVLDLKAQGANRPKHFKNLSLEAEATACNSGSCQAKPDNNDSQDGIRRTSEMEIELLSMQFFLPRNGWKGPRAPSEKVIL